MKVLFPSALDSFNLPVSVADKNASDTSFERRLDDAWYLFQVIQAKLGSDGSKETTSLDYRTAAIEAWRLTTLALLALLSLQAGKVGIGTTNPTALLDVNGTLNVAGAMTAAGATFSGNITSPSIQTVETYAFELSSSASARSYVMFAQRDTGGTITEIKGFRSGGTTTIINFIRTRGSNVDILSSNWTLPTSPGTAAGLQNTDLTTDDVITLDVRTQTGTATEVWVQISVKRG